LTETEIKTPPTFNPNFGFTKNNHKRSNPKSKKTLKIIAIVFIIIVVIFLARSGLKQIAAKNTAKTVSSQTQPVKSQLLEVNRKFTFDGLDETGKKKGKLEMVITTAEKTDSVIVQDKNYTAKNNKTFLILNLELINDSKDRLNIFPGDLIRLVVNNQEEKKFAPDLHNNYINVAPISTKIERVGFVIDASANNLKLEIGELEADKKAVNIQF